MFNSIAPRYDFLNHLLSLGIDNVWRRKAINMLLGSNPKKILDIACGTGDFGLEALRLNPERIIGIDLSEQMLQIASKKIQTKSLGSRFEFIAADAENLPFPENSFDAAIVAFGVRNFENLETGLTEISRVLTPTGELVVLEFSEPQTFVVKQMYRVYFRVILPIIGRLVSKDRHAYTYLPDSVYQFPHGNAFIEILKRCGFSYAVQKKLTFGISSIYYAKK